MKPCIAQCTCIGAVARGERTWSALTAANGRGIGGVSADRTQLAVGLAIYFRVPADRTIDAANLPRSSL